MRRGGRYVKLSGRNDLSESQRRDERPKERRPSRDEGPVPNGLHNDRALWVPRRSYSANSSISGVSDTRRSTSVVGSSRTPLSSGYAPNSTENKDIEESKWKSYQLARRDLHSIARSDNFAGKLHRRGLKADTYKATIDWLGKTLGWTQEKMRDFVLDHATDARLMVEGLLVKKRGNRQSEWEKVFEELWAQKKTHEKDMKRAKKREKEYEKAGKKHMFTRSYWDLRKRKNKAGKKSGMVVL